MGNPTIDVTGSTTNGPTSTITLTATLAAGIANLNSNNIEAWATYDGEDISNTVNLSPTLDSKVWNGTITNVDGSGITVWVVVFVTPPDDSQPFSNSVSYKIPAARPEKKKKAPPKPKAEKA